MSKRSGNSDSNSLLVEQAGKIAVKALVSGDELVGECQARHDAPLPQPEDGAETAKEQKVLERKAYASTSRPQRQSLCPPN